MFFFVANWIVVFENTMGCDQGRFEAEAKDAVAGGAKSPGAPKRKSKKNYKLKCVKLLGRK
jgi:hypothetical protein